VCCWRDHVPGARHFTELVCWQLSTELKLAIYSALARQAVRRDIRYCDQCRDAAAGVPRNIAEGFGRRTHRDFARFLDIARSSLDECENHLIDGRHRGHFSEQELRQLIGLVSRIRKAIAGLQKHLRA
jgi:four helix bundle protein